VGLAAYTDGKVDCRLAELVEEEVGWYLHQEVSWGLYVSRDQALVCGPWDSYPTKRMLTAVWNSVDVRFRSRSSPASRAAAMLFLAHFTVSHRTSRPSGRRAELTGQCSS
jgi:hypothetical protein